MANIPNKVADRLVAGLKRFQSILESARTRDINEADTSVIVSDMLSDLFGYDKYSEVTREHAIRGTFCDLAIKIDNELQFIIEVKAIGLELKDMHIKQAVDYAANQGVDWVMLTNAVNWKVFRVTFGKPIDSELVLDIDLLSLSHRSGSHIEALYHLTREGLLKGALPAYHAQQEATNRFFLAAIVLSDPVINMIRRELRRASPDVRIGPDQIRASLTQDVLKREVVVGEKADEARKKINRAIGKAVKAKAAREPRAPRLEPASTDTSMQPEMAERLSTTTEA